MIQLHQIDEVRVLRGERRDFDLTLAPHRPISRIIVGDSSADATLFLLASANRPSRVPGPSEAPLGSRVSGAESL
jgi:hypothetical protein